MPHSGRILCRDVIPSAVRSGGPRRAYRTRALRMRHEIIFRSRTGLCQTGLLTEAGIGVASSVVGAVKQAVFTGIRRLAPARQKADRQAGRAVLLRLILTGVRPSGLRPNTGPNGPGTLISPSGTDRKLLNGPGSDVN